ncbi:uncharacterized protein LOC111286311 isoform X2 [Durio zibethinus]|uniref:Uncharacterized protein LOC111286311 isoform X2 n=1 Tax=Durio zibethinus TaxID=66656 RepID=A0A6P5XUQ9_DURZI|nr:uncharacterized protein LOC111286311 isoform X2 [Durio zibethinus]
MEEEKHFSCDNTAEMGDGYSIFIELSDDDPFFDKKKRLLSDRGFGVKEIVCIKSSLGPDSLSATLNQLLQIARIIRLDEVELYFGQADGEEFYSSRNEMEALNLILSLIKTSFSSQVHMQMRALQDLRNAILNRIHALGAKDKVESKMDINYKCDKEKRLVQWAENNGGKTRLQIAYIEGAGRGAIAMEDLEVGDIALEIPASIIISEDLVHKTDMYQILAKIDGMSSETMSLLWSMKEKYNCNSQFKIYFDTLPENFNTGLSFGVEAIMALDGTLLFEEIMQAKEHLHLRYDELFPALSNEHPDIFPPELYTWEQFLWACELWYSNSMKILFADGKLRTCLIPVGGFLNHSLIFRYCSFQLHPHIVHYGKVDSATNSLKFPLSRPCTVGEQCCLSYGNFSGSHLITFYGFLPQGDNPYDVIPLDFDVDQVDSIEDCPLYNWSSHMVRGTWLSNNQNIFYYGLPLPLLDYLRRARSPMPFSKSSIQSDLEVDKEVLEDLQSTFNDLMENLGDTDLVDRENASWDVKLALEFKEMQRRIVSSILTSCSTGVKMVEYELSKCKPG